MLPLAHFGYFLVQRTLPESYTAPPTIFSPSSVLPFLILALHKVILGPKNNILSLQSAAFPNSSEEIQVAVKLVLEGPQINP
jgi:hypothetical protein